MKCTFNKAQWLSVIHDDGMFEFNLHEEGDECYIIAWDDIYFSECATDEDATDVTVVKDEDGIKEYHIALPSWLDDYQLEVHPQTAYQPGESYGERYFIVKHTPTNTLHKVSFDYDSWVGCELDNIRMCEVVEKTVTMTVYEEV